MTPSRMASGATGVSMQPEREAGHRAWVRVPREQRRGVAESEGCERHLLRVGGIVNATAKPRRRLGTGRDLRGTGNN
jgi:hypothetical protein